MPYKMTKLHICPVCHEEFKPKYPRQRFNSTTCAAKFKARKRSNDDSASSYDLTMLEKSLVELQARMAAEREAERARVVRRVGSLAEAEASLMS